MEEVAAEAQLSRAAIYRHFPNKQALVDEVLETNARRFRLELTALLEQEATLADKVGAAARFGHFPPRDLLLLGLTETDPESLSYLLTTDAHRFLDRATRFWEPHVVQAIQRREISRRLEPRQAAEWIARSFFSLATVTPQSIDATDPGAVERYARTFIIGGLRQR